jgi:hypothetical protein
MAKYPRVGAVKTRLAHTLGPEAAAALSRAFIVDLDRRLRAEVLAPIWAYTPGDAPFGALVPQAQLIVQPPGDLGARMLGVVGALQAERPGPIVVLGADVPHVDVAVIRRAAAALAGGAELVIGPTRDGGYYLLGLRAPYAALFHGMPWGGASVYAETRARAQRLGLDPVTLPETFDVDEAADLVRLAALLANGAVSLPDTAAVLAGLGISSPSRCRPV